MLGGHIIGAKATELIQELVNVKALEGERAALEKELQETQQSVERRDIELGEARETIAALEETLGARDREIAALNGRVEGSLRTAASRDEEIAGLRERLSVSAEQVARFEREREDADHEIARQGGGENEHDIVY